MHLRTAAIPVTMCALAASAAAQQSRRPPTWRERIVPYREVVLAAAKANLKRPAKKRAQGDALADLYLRTAADRLRSRIADVEDVRARRGEVRAFCVAMGVLLDSTGSLARNRFARFVLGNVETDAERETRTKVLGEPTLRARADWFRHFWVSVGLRALVGRAMTENVGVAKEFADAKRLSTDKSGEGFSMGDLCADLAGIELSEKLFASGDKPDGTVSRLATKGRHVDWMPEAKALPVGLDADAAAKRYGHAGDPRLRRALADLRVRVRAMPAHKPPPKPPVQPTPKKRG